MGVRAVAVALAFAAAAVLPAAGGGGQAGGTRTLRVDLYADVPFIDPAYDSSLRYFSSGWQISRVAGLKLLDFPDTGGAAGSTLRPQAATAMPKVSKDGKTYTFTIRKRLRFSSGERVTAANFDRTIERALAGGPLAKRLAGDIVSSEPVGQSQLRVRLKAPSADFLARLSMVMDYLAFNHKRPLFENNTKLRQAVNFAIDRIQLSRGFLGGTTDQILPPGMPGYRDAKIYPDTPDLARANALAQGNLRGGKAELWVPATFTSIGAVVKFNLAQIGIDVTVKGIDPARTERRSGSEASRSTWQSTPGPATTRTRTTSSTSCSKAETSRRRTTTTSASSTTPSSTTGWSGRHCYPGGHETTLRAARRRPDEERRAARAVPPAEQPAPPLVEGRLLRLPLLVRDAAREPLSKLGG